MNPPKTTALLALGLTLTGATAFAQPGGTMMAPLNTTDRQFLTQNAQGSVADQAEAEIAVQQATDNTVQHYAIRLVEDHARLNMQLLLLAHNRGIMLPVVMAESDRGDVTALTQKSGADFDRAFLQQEVKINAQDVEDAQKELSVTTDAPVREFVQEFLNTERVHLDQARELLARTK